MLVSGTLLQNRYRILRLLGSGGQGAVYLAQHLGLNTYVAIKEGFSNDPTTNAQFQAEANLLARLSHLNLPRVTDFFVEPSGARYLVMEYVQGESLERVVKLRGAPVPEREALAWFHQILDAVQYLHGNQVIHRDIKPQNIIITPQHRAVLVDLGIAKVMASGSITGQSIRFGTAGYAPPEQYSGGTGERSDIYSLGASLYFAMTGRPPIEAPMRASGVKLLPPRQINTGISAKVGNSIVKAMEMSAARRFQSIKELTNALATRPFNHQIITLVGFVSTAIILVLFFLVMRPLPNWGVGVGAPPTSIPVRVFTATSTLAPPVSSRPTSFVTPILIVPTQAPTDNETPATSIEGQPTPIDIEPTRLATPTTVDDVGQPAQATPVPAIDQTTQQPTAGTCTNPYTVQPGEWFYAIARKCGYSPEALLAANPRLNPSDLPPGSTLNLPPPEIETPAIIATRSTGSIDCPNPYIVQSSDTLPSIARKCGTTPDALQQINSIPSPDFIFPGQLLSIP